MGGTSTVMVMRWFRRLKGRVTGVSTPFGGVSFEPGVVDAEVARSLIAFLEDRRVLYEPTEVEMADHCIQSVLEIRRRLTQVLERGGIEKTLADHVRGMRAAARRFAQRIGTDPDNEHPPDDLLIVRGGRVDGLADWRLNQALGELRGVFGVHLSGLANAYGIEIGPPLNTILPPSA